MTAYLAVDGGNSKTDAIVGTDDGRLLAYASGPGTCYQTIGLPEAMTRLRDLVARVRAEAGVTALDRAEFYLAGADLPEEVEMLTAAVTEQAWARTVRLDNDMFALLRAGIDRAGPQGGETAGAAPGAAPGAPETGATMADAPETGATMADATVAGATMADATVADDAGPGATDAVAVVCGAGTNAVGRTRDGRLARFPGLGELSGDWGGGWHLARLALWHAIRSEDGRGPATALARAVADHFGASTSEEVAVRVHGGAIDRSALLDLAPVLFAVAAAGDRVAREVVARQAEEIVALATVAARRLNLLDADFVVVLGGGVLRARHRLLMDAITDGIAASAPRAAIAVVDAPPVLGAGLSALDAYGAGPAARAALRRAVLLRDHGVDVTPKR